MTMTGGTLAPLLTISPDKETSLAPPDDDPGMAMRPARADARPPNSDSCTAPTATIRHALRALASESGPGKGLNQVRLLRPLVAQAHDILRERFESGGSAEEYLRGRARLADSLVIGLLHIESISSGMRNGSVVAHSLRLRRAATDEENSPPAPTSTCSSSSLKAAPERSRRQRERASAPWLPASGILASCWIMRRGRSRNASSLPRTIPPCLPAWLTGGTCGAVRACLLPSMPSLRRVSPDPTRDAGGTRSAALCRLRLAMHRAMCMPWRTSPT
jgi:hypothetical protein